MKAAAAKEVLEGIEVGGSVRFGAGVEVRRTDAGVYPTFIWSVKGNETVLDFEGANKRMRGYKVDTAMEYRSAPIAEATYPETCRSEDDEVEYTGEGMEKIMGEKTVIAEETEPPRMSVKQISGPVFKEKNPVKKAPAIPKGDDLKTAPKAADWTPEAGEYPISDTLSVRITVEDGVETYRAFGDGVRIEQERRANKVIRAAFEEQTARPKRGKTHRIEFVDAKIIVTPRAADNGKAA